MASIGEITIKIIDKISTETAKSLESVLQQFRDACHSDEEFSQRTSVSKETPNVEQYYFDCKPVFYTEMKIENNTFLFSFHHGKYQD